MRILYHMPLCPSCRSIRVAMREKDIDCDLVQENLWDQKPQFLALNPAGELPALVEDDGMVVAGSYAISEFLDEIQPMKALMGISHGERAEIRRLIDWFGTRFNNEVTRLVVHEKVYKRQMQQGEPDSQTIRIGKRNIYYHLDYIANLARERHFLAGDSISFADIIAAAHISSLDYLGDVPWDHNSTAKEWYALVKSRPAFRPILADRVPSFRPPGHYENPDF